MNAYTVTETPLQLIRRWINCLEKHEDQIRTALKYGGDTESFESVCARVLKGELTLHELPNSVVVTEIIKYGGGLSYHSYLIAGDLEEVIEYQRGPIQMRAKAAGCNILTGSGRKGWTKPLLAEGWKILRVNFVKEL